MAHGDHLGRCKFVEDVASHDGGRTRPEGLEVGLLSQSQCFGLPSAVREFFFCITILSNPPSEFITINVCIRFAVLVL